METLTLLSVKIPQDLKSRLEAAAALEGRTVSSFTRFYLDKKLTPSASAPAKKKGARRP